MTDPVVLDTAAYARRTGHADQEPPTLAALADLIRHHQAAIPFENIDVLAGRVPRLDLASIQHKLVAQRRGGYCYEQNSLFKAVLAHLGYTVDALEARVRAGVPAEVSTGRTHMALRVTIEGQAHLVDVGFGGLSPEGPLLLSSREVQVTAAGSAFRFVRADADADAELSMQTLAHDGWSEGYRLCRSLPTPVDLAMGNWFVATHPTTMLRQNLLVSHTRGQRRVTLFNDQLTVRIAGTPTQEQTRLGTRAGFAEVLADEFGLQIAPDDLDAVLRVIEQRALAAADGAP